MCGFGDAHIDEIVAFSGDSVNICSKYQMPYECR
jgi:hypothetical protein